MAFLPGDPERGLEMGSDYLPPSSDQLFEALVGKDHDRKGWRPRRYAAYNAVLGYFKRILSHDSRPEQLFEWRDHGQDATHRVITCACTEFRVGYTHTVLKLPGDHRFVPEYRCTTASFATVGRAVGYAAADVPIRFDSNSSSGFVMLPPPRGVAMARLDATSFWYHRNPADTGHPHLQAPENVVSVTDIQRQLGVLTEAAYILEQCNELTRDDVRTYTPTPPPPATA